MNIIRGVIKRTFILLAFTFVGGVIWWRAWMYHGLTGPVPFLHWYIFFDGEASYDLTQYEMFVHLFIAGSLAILLRLLLKQVKSWDART